MKHHCITLLSMLLTASTFQTGSAANDKLTGSTAPILNRLQKNPGKLADGTFYVPAAADTFQWGWIPNQNSKPILTVPSGSLVTFDCLSGEGFMEDQGRDPQKFFGKHGVAPAQVLDDAVEIAASDLKHDFDKDGPHIIIGPVAVEGAQPGDVLKIEMVSFKTRVPYGVICSEHGTGCLVGEFPENAGRKPGASAAHPELFNSVHTFVPIKEIDGKQYGTLHTASGKEVTFPIDPFIGTLGAAPNTTDRVISVPPSNFGGNLDLKELTAGSTLYVPIQLPGAQFFIGDPHFAQGDGEVALTAIEGSLRATLRLSVLKAGDAGIPGKGPFTQPFAETPDYWIPIGLDPNLSEAMKKAVRASIKFLTEKMGMDRATALAYLSAATDFHVTQVVDRIQEIHGRIRKKDFAEILVK
jgi:acetamidase/formamidase